MMGMPVELRDRLALVSPEVRDEVRRAHHQLGHPGRDTMSRLARLSKKSDDHIFYIKHFKCPLCLRRQAPGQVRQGSRFVRPFQFNMVVGVDLKEGCDIVGERFLYLNILDVATRFSVFVLLSGKSSREVAEAFQTAWSWAGPPVQILHDQGTEFAKDFTALARRLGADTRVTPTEAPWQNSMVERHGAVLGEVLAALVQQCQLEGERDMRLGGVFAAAAKNRRPDRSGHSARSRVFGQEERFPGSIVDAMQDGENPAELEEALLDPVFARSLEIRQHAQSELIRLDNSEVWRRALTSGTRAERAVWVPGAQVYYWRRQWARGPHMSSRASEPAWWSDGTDRPWS